MTAQILVIDDSATMRKLVEIAFRGTDCQVRFAGTGREGLLQATTSPPDAILLDFMLPDMKGLEVCTQLAQRAETAKVGVVIMSGKPEVAELFREAPNVVAFLPKPFTTEAVQTRLSAAMRHGDHSASRSPTSRLRKLQLSDEPSTTGARPPTAPASVPGGALTLHGSLSAVALYDVLRLVTASTLAGELALDTGELVYVANGNIVLCTTTKPTDELDQLALRGGGDLESALGAARVTQRQTGKPALATLAEGGFETEVDVAAALKAHGYRLLTQAMGARAGAFTWRELRLPAYVEAFGRPLSLTAAALDHVRAAARPVAAGAELLDHVYQRAAKFSDHLAGLRLTSAERAVLAAIDGTASLRAIAERTRLSSRQVASTISHLASVELVGRVDPEASYASLRGAPPLVVHDLDADFVTQLRALLARRPLALAVLEVANAAELDTVVLRAKPQLILVGADTRALPPELRALARLTSATLVAVLEVADDKVTADTLALGYDAVLFKPVHVTELDRLLAL